MAVPTRVRYEGRVEPQLRACCGFRSVRGALQARLREPAVPRLRAAVPCASRQQGKPEAGGAGSPHASCGRHRPGGRGQRRERPRPLRVRAPPLPPRAPHRDLPAAGAGRRRRTDSSAGQSALGAARGAPPLHPDSPIRGGPAGRGRDFRGRGGGFVCASAARSRLPAGGGAWGARPGPSRGQR